MPSSSYNASLDWPSSLTRYDSWIVETPKGHQYELNLPKERVDSSGVRLMFWPLTMMFFVTIGMIIGLELMTR